MGGLFVLIFIVGVVAAVARVYSGVAAVRRLGKVGFNQQGVPFGLPGIGLDPQFMAMMQQIQTLVAQAQQAQAAGGLPPHLQSRFNRQVAAANQQMRDLDSLSRQRHEVFMADMTSQAASAGIDISSFNR